MKRSGLVAPFFVATLFLGTALGAGEAMTPPAAADSPMTMPSSRAADLLKRFDRNGDGKIDDGERADAHETMLKEQSGRAAARAPGTAAEAFRRRMLERFDRDKDGRLDDGERAAAREFADERGLGPDGEIRAELVKRFDTNGDGKLDEAERTAMQQTLRARAAAVTGFPAIRQEVLARFDRNGDGLLDDGEFAEVEPVLRARFEQSPVQLKRIDRDKDGRIDDAEWSAARQPLRIWLGKAETSPPATPRATAPNPTQPPGP